MTLVPKQKILKDLMLGLIYPAVLGNIIYLVLRIVFDQVDILLDHSYRFDWIATSKFLLLVITLAFYFCDYLYITFTNDFLKMFFWFDVAFIFVLFCTIYLIHIDRPDIAPNNSWILICYLVFMALYWIWDRHERNKCEDDEERKLYEKIIRWEKFSIGGILLWLFLSIFSPKAGYYLREGSFILLTVITGYFAKYTYAKRRFYRSPEI